MAVPCPRCGRQYDAALFQFGRTIHCTCGSRVALEARRRPLPDPLRFAADAMLGRLARWLRLVGCDTAYVAHIADGELVRRALEEGRVILTRDRRLPEQWRVPHVMVLRSEDPLAQLRQVLRAYGIDWRAQLFSRCAVCNAPLAPEAPERLGDEVPLRVRAEQREFRRCRGCGKVYWPGSHVERIRTTLERAVG
jgi:uncharacterized protein with PIN domain